MGLKIWEIGNIEGDIDMTKKLISWKTKGMNRDTSVSAFNPEFSFENRNIRLSTNDSNTQMSWVNEKGTKAMSLYVNNTPWSDATYVQALEGIPVGTAVLNHKLVLFTVSFDNKDNYIYVLWTSDKKNIDLEGKLLFQGKLNITVEHPLETLVSYESENIQKVYWTDGVNQPRVINIAADKEAISKWHRLGNSIPFDFVPDLQLGEDVKVTKMLGSGEFPAGVIQYAFTYYNKYGQESNLFYTTPLQYIAYVDRGGSPDSKIANSFKIEISNIDGNFDYLRIYSILRTSRDATPLVKRVQDIEIESLDEESGTYTASYIDDGLHGETVDPTELLYKGGENIVVETLEQKDGTLFFGNIRTTKPPIKDIRDNILDINGVKPGGPSLGNNIQSTLFYRHFTNISKEPFSYVNTLSCISENTDYEYEGAAGFKSREYYRLGVQFQYKNGKWSEPCWIGDKQQESHPVFYDKLADENITMMGVPGFTFTLRNDNDVQGGIITDLYNAGYRRARAVFAVPSMSDRTILCQGVGCPTMYRTIDRYADAHSTGNTGDSRTDSWTGSVKGKLYAQSSWLFRCPTLMQTKSTIDTSDSEDYDNADASNGGGKVSYKGKLRSQYNNPYTVISGKESGEEKDYLKVMSPYLRDTEVMGFYDDGHAFYVDDFFATIHSPEFIFDDSFASMDFNGCKLDYVGYVPLDSTYGDIDIQVSTPAIGSDAAGFVHRSIVTDGAAALISAPFFNDYVVEASDNDKYQAYNTSSPALNFPVYMWHKNGSLNNDVARNNRSAELLKKRISNYRLGGETKYTDVYEYTLDDTMQLFRNEELSVVKVDGNTYMGNIETMLTPTTPSPYFLVGNPWGSEDNVDFNMDSYYFLAMKNPYSSDSLAGIWSWKKGSNGWGFYTDTNKGDDAVYRVKGLAQWREPVSMKYKSTPHLVAKLSKGDSIGSMIQKNSIYHDRKVSDALPMVEIVKPYDSTTFFGGTSDEIMQSLTWIPCGPVVSFDGNTEEINVEYKWGDAYVQRFECLKTYPFTPEDKNQVVEIASFVCETRVNIDGRYDRNRGQASNLNMTPQNFNLLNPIYSQMDNFFSYKILPEDSYNISSYPNNITWTKTKQNGADVDLWTNITLANTLELDGDKGEITKILRLNNQLIAFQDSGISQILYNENTQISTTEGVPIEIANSEKVQGKRYLSDTVGCSNKWSIAQTPIGIYFMDSNEKSIYMFNGQLNNISTSGGFNSWAKQNIPAASTKWNPKDFKNFVACYDKANQDVLFINENEALAYSEKFNCFTSFYDYGKAPFLCSLDDTSIWINRVITNVEESSYLVTLLWQHQAGDYCNFFTYNKPFYLTLVANQEPQVDKIFTNLEFRACIEGEGTYDKEKDSFVPSMPFDTIEVWNEYQHGMLSLSIKNKENTYSHGLSSGILDRKFRIWRCDIPRDNVPPSDSEVQMGIKRFKARPLDRIRNPWTYIKLKKNEVASGTLDKIEVHDIVVTYFA